MKTSQLLLVAGLAALLGVSTAKADPFVFDVDINTAALASDIYAPFYLDFQLIQGSASASSTVTLSHFVFTDGNAVAGTTTATGLASGDLASSITLGSDPSNFLNEFNQQFTSGTTDIKFQVTASQAFTGLTPTGFSISILDNSLGFPAQIYTTDPNAGLSLITLGLNASNTLKDVSAYTSTDPTPLGVTAKVPDAANTAALVGLTVAVLAFWRRRQTLAAAA